MKDIRVKRGRERHATMVPKDTRDRSDTVIDDQMYKCTWHSDFICTYVVQLPY